MNIKKKICIGVPTNRGVKSQTVLSLLNIVNTEKYDYHFVVASQGYTIAENRIYIVTQAIKNGCTHILFVDDDMTFPQHTLDQLLSHEKEVVGVVAYSRALPLMPVVEFFDQEQMSTTDRLLGNYNLPSELFKVKMVGGGVVLIDLTVFDKIEKPWFNMTQHEFGMTKMGEDAWFCQQVRNAGIDIWCDPTLSIGHIGDYVYGK